MIFQALLVLHLVLTDRKSMLYKLSLLALWLIWILTRNSFWVSFLWSGFVGGNKAFGANPNDMIWLIVFYWAAFWIFFFLCLFVATI